jgi:hypothetical protein
MNHKLMTLAAFTAAAVALPGVTAAQKKPDQELSIAASKDVVRFGKDLKVTGKLTGGTAREVSGQNVRLERDAFPYEGDFERVDNAQTNDTGDYSFTLKPASNAKYRVVAKGDDRSPEVTVNVRVAVTLDVADTSPERGTRVEFSGAVAPAHDGKKVKVQRRKRGGGWKTIKRATLVDAGELASNYSTKVRIRRSGRYRVRFNPKDGDHVAGKSSRVRITAG